MANVVLRDVTKRFGNLTAVRSVSLEVKDGEFMVLVGPSGCGKTTILRMIAGLEEITNGEIWIGDRLVNDVPPKDRDIAMVFQNYALYPHMSVYDNIAFGLKLRKVPRVEIERRVQQAAEMLGILDKVKSKPKELSGGQRQRVAVGRAIVREPEVFLFDEPLSNLDAKLRVHMRAELQELHRKLQTTTVYVTHDQVEAMTLGQRVAVLRGGVLQQIDTPQRLYDHPANVFVAGFIGSPSMNFLSGRLIEEDGGLFVAGDGFRLALVPEIAECVREQIGREVVVGIRPEHLQVAPMEDQSAELPPDRLRVHVRVVEPLGSEMIVHGDLGGVELVAKLDPDARVSVDRGLTLTPEVEKIHLFDRETEQSLLPPQLPVEEPGDLMREEKEERVL
jgi:multiple sugar transport system ATP-binding protein